MLSCCAWRRGRDSNPRDGCPPTRVPGVRLQPLGHLSAAPSWKARYVSAQYTEHRCGCKPIPVSASDFPQSRDKLGRIVPKFGDRGASEECLMQRITITIDDDLMAEVEHFMQTRGYEARSEVFRDLLRGAGAGQPGQRRRRGRVRRGAYLCLRPRNARTCQAPLRQRARESRPGAHHRCTFISITKAAWKWRS